MDIPITPWTQPLPHSPPLNKINTFGKPTNQPNGASDRTLESLQDACDDLSSERAKAKARVKESIDTRSSLASANKTSITSLAVKVKVRVRASPQRKVKVADATRPDATVKSFSVICYCRVGIHATVTHTYARTTIGSSIPLDTPARITKSAVPTAVSRWMTT